MTRRATPQPGVDRMVSTSWSGRRWSSPAARQGRALARGLEGRLPLQHHYVRDQNSSSSRCRAYFSLALKHGIYREQRPVSLNQRVQGSSPCAPAIEAPEDVEENAMVANATVSDVLKADPERICWTSFDAWRSSKANHERVGDVR